MAQVHPESKVFLIVSPSLEKTALIEQIIRTKISEPVIYTAPDGALAVQKLNNVPPQVMIVDSDIPKMSAVQMIGYVTVHAHLEQVAMIVLDSPPEQERFIDEIVAARLQFLQSDFEASDLLKSMYRALDYSFFRKKTEFTLRFLVEGERLITEGDKADFVYFVKKGSLRAFRKKDNQSVELGKILVGEFVGEMSYINGEARTASVEALEPCELIEVPIGIFETILYRRPSWSRALMTTLAKRLKGANAYRSSDDGSGEPV